MSDQKPVALLEQIKRDAATVAAWPEETRRLYERELRAIFCNPGIVFPSPPASEPVPEVAGLVEKLLKKADYTDSTFDNHSLGDLYRQAAALLSAQAVMLEEARVVIRRYRHVHGILTDEDREELAIALARLEASHVG